MVANHPASPLSLVFQLCENIGKSPSERHGNWGSGNPQLYCSITKPRDTYPQKFRHLSIWAYARVTGMASEVQHDVGYVGYAKNTRGAQEASAKQQEVEGLDGLDTISKLSGHRPSGTRRESRTA